MSKNLSEEEKQRRSERWEFALGLQKIDNFEPDEEYLKLIQKEINGEITLAEMSEIILEKYKKYGCKN